MTQCERVYLIGMMGAGKTTVGRIVADCLGWSYIDSDEQVVARAGRTVREIFESEGEAAFRALERDAVAEASRHRDVVVAVAGGAVLDPDVRALLREHEGTLVVWLRASAVTLTSRVDKGGQAHRPLLANDARAVLEQLSEEREPLYRQCADLVVDVDGVSPKDVAGRVVAAVGG